MALWGMGRTLMLEHPELRCTLIDVDDSAHLADVLARESRAGDGESQIAWRGAARHALRLRPVTPEPSEAARPLRTDGSVLITGGLGALGLQAAQSLAQRGMKHLILASRHRVQPPPLRERLAELQRLGTRVGVVTLDVRELEALRAVLDQIPKEAPLRGVIHAAGSIDDGPWLEQTPARLATVMTPKVIGAWNLHRLTRDADLDLFVMFSSLAGTLGSPGQAGYAAANACLDALADHRRALGLPAQSLAFGPWEVGMTATLTRERRERLAQNGIGLLSSDRGRAAFESAIARPEPALVVADLRPELIARASSDGAPGIWRELLPARAANVAAAAPRDWRTQLDELASDADRLARVTHWVAEEAGRILSTPPEHIPDEQTLGDLGMDSLMTLDLRRDLSRRSGLEPAAVVVTSRSTVSSLASGLLASLRRRPSEPPASGRMAMGRCIGPVPKAKARLFCFHYAGGSSEIFESFDELAEHGIEVHTISHTRARPASIDTARRFLAEASAYIAARTDMPYAIFGHSLGGLLACRVLEEMLDQSIPPPQLFIPSAAAFPEDLAGDFSQAALSQAFRRIVGEAGQRAEASDSLLDDFIADALLWRHLPAKAPRALPVRMLAVVARGDHIASERAMREWAARTSSGFELVLVPGDHFYLSDARPRREMLEEISRQMLNEVASAATV